MREPAEIGGGTGGDSRLAPPGVAPSGCLLRRWVGDLVLLPFLVPGRAAMASVRQSGVLSPPFRRVLDIGAHHDDLELGTGGTVSLLADQGVEVTFLILTDGHRGGSSQDRHLEASTAAGLLGV